MYEQNNSLAGSTQTNKFLGSEAGLIGVRTEKISQIDEQIQNINQNLSFLQDRVSLLRQKLCPILRERDEETKDVVSNIKQDLTPLAGSLSDIAFDIQFQARGIDDLIKRIEL